MHLKAVNQRPTGLPIKPFDDGKSIKAMPDFGCESVEPEAAYNGENSSLVQLVTKFMRDNGRKLSIENTDEFASCDAIDTIDNVWYLWKKCIKYTSTYDSIFQPVAIHCCGCRRRRRKCKQNPRSFQSISVPYQQNISATKTVFPRFFRFMSVSYLVFCG